MIPNIRNIQVQPCKISLLDDVVKRDIPELTRSQDSLIEKACRRIVAGNIQLEDIVELKGFPGFFRWKPSTEIRHQCDCEIRMVYRYLNGSIQVIAVRSRHDVYRVATKRIQRHIEYA